MDAVCVLVVEDDLDLAALMKEALVIAGFEVAHVSTVEAAFDTISGRLIHVAVLDINVGQELVFPVATLLQAMSIPFVFASGADFDGESSGLRPHALVPKPYRIANVIEAITAALSKGVSDEA